MVHPLAADQRVEEPSVAARPRSRSALFFAIGFGAAALLTAVAVLLMLSGEGLAGDSTLIFTMLGVSAVISLGLGGILVHRLRRVAQAWASAATGARLHTRFVALFSIAALAPAVIVALFFGFIFSQGVERWFGERVETTIENGRAVGAAYVRLASGGLGDEMQTMGEDLNVARQGLTDDPELYRAFLAAQAQRRSITSAYVVTRAGSVLSRAEPTSGDPGFARPAERDLLGADEGDVSISFDDANDRVVGVYRLRAYPDAYLVATRSIEPGLVSQLRAFRRSVADYRSAQTRRGSVNFLFGFAYVDTALLVLLGAIWVGLASATRVAEPIGRLAEAARQVAAGDLKVRVPVGAERDEVDALAGAFNTMTAQLEAQRRALLEVQEDTESRRRFIETVLGGVSAGVMGLDSNARITAANASAVHLLGHDNEDLIGRRLVDIAPEFSELLNQARPTAETAPQRIDLVRENFSANLSVRMTPDADGGLVLTFDDMTKLIAAQRQEAWKDVARRIAHEIKNPLTPIQLSADRLKRKFSPEITSDPETFAKCTDTILRQVADIGRMVDEFSSFARMPAPQMKFTDMAEVARNVVFSQHISFADVRVEGEGIAEPIGLVCDGRLIGQALLNLIKNAAESVQARRARDGEPKDGFVILRLRDLEYGVQFEVIDNGLGFPAQNRERLIEPYVTTRTKGHGLGLAIVARVVEDHGGLIELDDAPGAGPGAVVRFVLPKRGEEPAEPAAANGEGAP
ncbi:ATP-binding protein [Terricaulis sp.]|uniref:sensor histidine kinase NtrY-like n=1 Tax=Terricaulis sp. TaxID=2768686 RepID=UPI00378333EC